MRGVEKERKKHTRKAPKEIADNGSFSLSLLFSSCFSDFEWAIVVARLSFALGLCHSHLLGNLWFHFQSFFIQHCRAHSFPESAVEFYALKMQKVFSNQWTRMKLLMRRYHHFFVPFCRFFLASFLFWLHTKSKTNFFSSFIAVLNVNIWTWWQLCVCLFVRSSLCKHQVLCVCVYVCVHNVTVNPNNRVCSNDTCPE